MNQIINFISSDKGYIIVVLVILVVAFFVSKKNLYDEKDKPGSSLKITLTMFILCMIGIAGYIIAFGTNISDANILSTIASFTAPFIAFSGAYLIFEFGQKKTDREKKLENDKKIDHKKQMLFTMLEYSIVQTRIATKEIEKQYKNYYEGLNIGHDVFLHKKYNLTGKFKDDFEKMALVKSAEDCKTYMNFCSQLDGIFVNILDKHKISDRVIYIKDWYNYLDCVSNLEDLNTIILWINILNYSEMGVNCYTYMFISNRYNIDNIIKKYYPKAVDEGVRGKFDMKNIEEN